MEGAGPQPFSVGDWQVDPRIDVIVRSGTREKLVPRTMQVLVHLAQHAGEVVSGDELERAVWQNVIVTQSSVYQAIADLRRALQDDRDQPQFIETIPRKGYRMIAPVRWDAAASDSTWPSIDRRAPTESARVDPKPPADSPAARNRRLNIFLGLLLAAALGAGGYWATQRPHPAVTTVTKPARVMIAVLPFQNLTGDAAQDYLSDGLTEEMISQMGQLSPERFGVIARTSSMAYKKTEKTVAQIGKELGVDYMLESSVRGNAKQMRLTVQLIRVRDQTHVWAHEYDEVATKTLDVQTQIMHSVASQLAIILAPGIGVPSKTNQEAYELYLEGRFYWNERSVDGLTKAVDYFQRAIAKDPGYAPAYSGLADCYQLLVYFDQLQSADGIPKARSAALQAIELDDKLAEAHTSLASIKGDFDWDWAGAEAEYKRAIELNPNYATAYHWYGDFLAGIGRLDEGMAEVKRAQAIDPLSPVIGVTLGQMYCRANRCEQGIAEYKRVLDMFPTFLQAKAALVEAYVQLGQYQLAMKDVESPPWSTPNPSVQWGETLWGYVFAKSGRKAEALQIAREVERRANWDHKDYTLAVIYAGVGDKDQAFAKLEGARRSHDYYMASIGSDTKLASLRVDPRYNELIRRMNIPTPSR